MKTLENILDAKAEILDGAEHGRAERRRSELAAAADRIAATKRVIRCDAPAGGTPTSSYAATTRAGCSMSGARPHRVTVPAEVGHPPTWPSPWGWRSRSAYLRRRSSPAGLGAGHAAPRRDRDPGQRADRHRRHLQRQPGGRRAALVSAGSLVGEGGTVWTMTPGMVELATEQARRTLTSPGRHGHRGHATVHRGLHQPGGTEAGTRAGPRCSESRRGGGTRDVARRVPATCCCTRTICPTTTRDRGAHLRGLDT